MVLVQSDLSSMRTADARAIRRFLSADPVQECERADPRELLEQLRPVPARVRAGEWRLEVTGPRTTTDINAAAMFQARPFEFLDAFDRTR